MLEGVGSIGPLYGRIMLALAAELLRANGGNVTA